jgi:hypothetical protein|tara:strand:- start:2805 stop:3413 length:609 start_codon:yes stop_codon:yes gene_type:complete
MDITTFSQTIEVFEKNIKNLIKYELIHMYHKISEKYKIPFDDLIKKCEYVYKDEYVSFPKMLDIRETARIEFRLSNAIHNTAIERLDIIKCNTIERLSREKKGLINISSCLEYIIDTHTRDSGCIKLCCGISNSGKICMKSAKWKVGSYKFCKSHAKSLKIDSVPIISNWRKVPCNVSNDSSSNNTSDDESSPLPITKTVFK